MGGEESELFGPERGQCLWQHLGEDQDDECQEAGDKGDALVAPNCHCQDSCERGGKDINEVVAKQNQPDKTIWLVEQRCRLDSAAMAVFCQISKSVSIECHQCGFGSGKKSGKSDQYDDRKRDKPSARGNVVQVGC